MNSTPAFIENNLGLVHLCANRFKGKGIEYDDLYSAGCIGLLKSVKAFDENRGVKFSTYAVPVILGEIKRLFRDGGSIKVSRSLKELSLKITRERENYIKKHGSEPSISELSKFAGADEAMVIEALSVSMPPISLTANNEDGESQADIPTESPDIEIGDILSLHQIMDTLEPNDRQLLQLRYYQSKTQSETAKLLSMTQVQVSRREKKLLAFIREKMFE